MATYYVATSGNNSNAGTSASPLKTIAYAVETKAKAGDTIIVQPGVYNEKFSPKRDITLRAQNRCVTDAIAGTSGTLIASNLRSVIDGTGLGGDLIQAGSSRSNAVNNFSIEGFEIRNASSGAGISLPYAWMITVRDNYVHHCDRIGIILRSGDLLLVENNIVHTCTSQIISQTGAGQGISILQSLDITGVTPPSTFSEYRTIVRKNRSYKNVPVDGAKSDGCGIIIDRPHTLPAYNYSGKILVEGNLCYGNGGPGIRVMQAKRVWVRHNTCFDNMQDKRRTTEWGCEFHETESRGNVWEYNIGLTSNPDNNTHAYQNTNALNIGDPPATNQSTFVGNIFDGLGSKDVTSVTNKSDPKGATPSGTTNKIGVNPKFVDADGGNFSLQSDSPALNYGSGGDWPHAGAVQPTVVVVAPFEADEAPTVTIATTANSGKSFTYANGTYTGGSGTLSRTHKMQTFVSGVWVDKGALTGGSGTFPTVTAATQFRVLETGIKGSDTMPNPSLPLTLQPEVITPTDPSDTAQRLTALESSMTAVLARLVALEGAVANPSPTADAALALAQEVEDRLATFQADIEPRFDRFIEKPEGRSVMLTESLVMASVPQA